MTKQEFLTLTPGTIVGVKQRRARLLNIYSIERGLGNFAYLPTNRKVIKSYRQVYLLDPTKANTAKELSKLPTDKLIQMLTDKNTDIRRHLIVEEVMNKRLGVAEELND